MEVIYDRHEEEWQKCLTDEERIRVAATWMQQGTLDRWRHERMLGTLKPLITPDSTWLTVGDGRYGTDANFILRNGGTAHASDISDTLLRIGAQAGFINEFSSQNAESLGFADESFDYVLIKEALHHLPRPWLALYEAFRVCRKGVILIEPNDDVLACHASLRGAAKNLYHVVRAIVRRKILRKEPIPVQIPYQFETVGNFIYSINEKELEKFLLGMHYRHLATYGMNDAYEDGVAFIRLDSDSREDQDAITRLKERIKRADERSLLGLQSFSILVAALFKSEPSQNLVARMSREGWNVKELPENPYL